jgi:hypothetical protein
MDALVRETSQGRRKPVLLQSKPLRSVFDWPDEAFNRPVLSSNTPNIFSFLFCLAGKTPGKMSSPHSEE